MVRIASIGPSTLVLLCGISAAVPAQGTRPQNEPLSASLNTPANAHPSSRDAVARLNVPPGFAVDVFAENLGGIRMFAVGDDGTLYVTRRDSGDVLAFPANGSGKATPRKVVRNLPRVHGVAVHRGQMYLATVREIYAAAVSGNGTVGEPRAIATDLPEGGQHPNRTIGIGPDGMLYVSVGSDCNRCNETNREHATILRMKVDGSARGTYASGLRNTVGWAWHPDSRDLWGMDHGSDWSGDDVPNEELNWIQPASHYGWPWCHGNREIDRLFAQNPEGSTKEEMCPRTVAAVLTYQAHSAPIQMAFYTGAQFPESFRGSAFIAMHGSWNRSTPTGYKVVRERKAGRVRRFSDGVSLQRRQDLQWTSCRSCCRARRFVVRRR